jgi:hypothetical protein
MALKRVSGFRKQSLGRWWRNMKRNYSGRPGPPSSYRKRSTPAILLLYVLLLHVGILIKSETTFQNRRKLIEKFFF